jgi:hypothetical protein
LARVPGITGDIRRGSGIVAITRDLVIGDAARTVARAGDMNIAISIADMPAAMRTNSTASVRSAVVASSMEAASMAVDAASSDGSVERLALASRFSFFSMIRLYTRSQILC